MYSSSARESSREMFWLGMRVRHSSSSFCAVGSSASMTSTFMVIFMIHSGLRRSVTPAQPGELIDTRSSTFLISEAIPSPMGAFLSAFEQQEAARNVVEAKDGTRYNWTELKIHFETAGLTYFE